MSADPIQARENIARFRELSRSETDESKRQTILRLIAEFEGMLASSAETPRGSGRSGHVT